MKRLIYCIFLCWLSVSVYGQKESVERNIKIDSTEISVRYKTRYKNPFWSNFYLVGDFSGRMLCSEEDSHLSIGDRIKPGFTFGIGKQLHPDYGIRVSFGGLRLDGWNSSTTPGVFKQQANWEQNKDPMKAYYESIGVDVSEGYVHQLRFFEVNADLVFNLHNLFTRYNNLVPRRWQWEAYGGVSCMNVMRWRGTSHNVKVGLRMGASCTYHINNRLGIQAQVGGVLTSATFDGVIGKGALYDGILSAGIGLKWYIGKQGFQSARMVPQEEIAKLNAITSTYEEKVKHVTVDKLVISQDMYSGLLIPSVLFFPYKAEFNYELQSVNVFQIAQFMKNYPETKVTVVGNVDEKYCRESLAKRRADKIRQILVTDFGIDSNRLSIDAYDINAKYGVEGYEHSVNFTFSR